HGREPDREARRRRLEGIRQRPRRRRRPEETPPAREGGLVARLARARDPSRLHVVPERAPREPRAGSAGEGAPRRGHHAQLGDDEEAPRAARRKMTPLRPPSLVFFAGFVVYIAIRGSYAKRTRS